jgi:RNA polymerase sigma factor (sigma-70 family)
MTDRWLLYQCSRGNFEALRRIYEKYRDYVLIIALSLTKDAYIAEDAVHDVFANFAEDLSRLKNIKNLKAYLTKCVLNRIREVLRSRGNPSLTIEELQISEPTSRNPFRQVVWNEELEKLITALAVLPTEQLQVIVLRFYGKMGFGTMGQILDVSTSTVKSRYAYGLKKLRQVMNKEFER